MWPGKPKIFNYSMVLNRESLLIPDLGQKQPGNEAFQPITKIKRRNLEVAKGLCVLWAGEEKYLTFTEFPLYAIPPPTLSLLFTMTLTRNGYCFIFIFFLEVSKMGSREVKWICPRSASVSGRAET